MDSECNFFEPSVRGDETYIWVKSPLFRGWIARTDIYWPDSVQPMSANEIETAKSVGHSVVLLGRQKELTTWQIEFPEFYRRNYSELFEALISPLQNTINWSKPRWSCSGDPKLEDKFQLMSIRVSRSCDEGLECIVESVATEFPLHFLVCSDFSVRSIEVEGQEYY